MNSFHNLASFKFILILSCHLHTGLPRVSLCTSISEYQIFLPGSCCGSVEAFALLGCYAELVRGWLPMFPNNLLPQKSVKKPTYFAYHFYFGFVSLSEYLQSQKLEIFWDVTLCSSVPIYQTVRRYISEGLLFIFLALNSSNHLLIFIFRRVRKIARSDY
jgi:hypothetical protein